MFAFITKANLLLMTIKLLFKGLLLAFITLGLMSCDNEPLEGEFPMQDNPLEIELGELRAQVDGINYVTSNGTAVIDQNGFMVLTAVNLSGNILTLAAENIGVGAFDIGAGNTGGTQNAAVFTLFNDGANPYISQLVLGGSGQMTITAYDTSAMTISGTFSFIAVRPGLDVQGNPIIGADGLPVIQTISIESGVFNQIPYENTDTGDGGDDPDPDPIDSFSAKVNDVFFLVDSLSVSRVVIADTPLIRIIAINSVGAKIRVDVPELLGVGNYEMVQISNGTELIGLYNSNTGGENLTSNPGSINITEFNTVTGVLTASFQFTGTDPLNTDPAVVEVSMGEFTVNYEPDPLNPNTPFTCEIDNVFFNPLLNVTAVETIVEGNNVILISATSGTEQVELLFPSTLIVGTYAMSENTSDGDEVVGSYRPDVGGATTFTSNPGELILTAIDLITGQLEGTFTFTASDPTDVDPAVYEVALGAFRLVIE
ncbi:MAG: hypothetical protein ACI86C_002033 [Candidatus Latescibacterota bacterium]|jgi:hypothetical protein